jgi:dCTP deaminase
MAYLGSEKLKELIKSMKVIEPLPDDSRLSERVKYGAYELSLGNEVYETDSNDGKRRKLCEANEQVIINPGQFALLLTEERVLVPTDKIAFISIKAGIKLKGLVNISGFHVDPGFEGKLIFSVYNAGSGPISIEKGNPCFLIWFSELDVADNEEDKYGGKHKGLDRIPVGYIDHLNLSDLASPNVLLDKINSNYNDLNAKATTRQYIYRIGIGVCIVVALKLLLDWGIYEKARKQGYAEKSARVELDSTINALLKEKLILISQIDSLNAKKNDALERTSKVEQDAEKK